MLTIKIVIKNEGIKKRCLIKGDRDNIRIWELKNDMDKRRTMVCQMNFYV